MTDWLRIFLDVEKKKPILVNLQELIKSRALLQANSGGDLFLDAGEVLSDRAEHDYEYNPINNPRPY